ncbi:hypothetical protein [Actinomadura terrae]|uniref:hypothetical protein n=1 Tax=Actinomadura terrae TaxID=604353 RepID=UPI001FA7226B|nr:hypothetical protein [Actinomadura terrae]
MRRLTALLAALATAGTLTLVTPAHAFAATGKLYLNDVVYLNPDRGCYNSKTGITVQSIGNRTNTILEIYRDDDCQGLAGRLDPDSGAEFRNTRSVLVTS